MMAEVILCRWCEQPVGPRYFELFDHVTCRPEPAVEATARSMYDCYQARAADLRLMGTGIRIQCSAAREP
jgi:hypothetical protein